MSAFLLFQNAMKLSSLSLSELEAMHGKYLFKAVAVWKIIQQRERIEVDEIPDFSGFKETTRRLLVNLWDATDKMLSHEDIRQDVILDEYASTKAIERMIAKAREEIAQNGFPYAIKNVWGKGYRLEQKRGGN